MSGNLLIIFVKAPRPGEVKTRIARVIGPQAASDAYVRIVGAVIENLRSLQNVQLRFSPDDALRDISRWLQPEWTAETQGNGDLGERLRLAFRDSFAAGVKRVVLVGSDCPDITAEDVQSAWNALENNDLVLGPAQDGGYWLIGLRTEQPTLFKNISWSGDMVLQQTITKAKSIDLSTQLLRELADIDTIEDLRRFEARSLG
jgi:rSAM/selenodomain-associated transferase 1